MGRLNKQVSKIAATSFMVVFFLSAATRLAEAIPTAEDIEAKAQAAKLTTDAFMQESLELRFKYEFNEKLLTQDDRKNLYKLAKTTGENLEAIAKTQKALKQQIKDYEGDDWDDKYGSTGLWRKLVRNLYTTSLSKCEIDFYLALSAQQSQRNKILHQTLDKIDLLDQDCNTAYAQFLKAKILALFARTDPNYKPLAKEQLNLLTERSDMKHSTAFRISIERIKLLGPTGPDELNKLAEAILQSSCADDIELVLSLASLQRRYDPEAFERTVQKLPRIENFLSSSILSELFFHIGRGQLDLQKLSTFEAELAAKAAWKNNPEQHKTLLETLVKIKEFQTPLTLYVTAIAFADSAPAKTAKLLIKASNLQQSQKSSRLDIEGHKIAEQAARLAYNIFTKDHRHCQLVLKAFENYCTMASEKIDEELEYLYTVVLNICGRTEKCKKLLQKIADRPAGKRRHRARLDLIIQAIEQQQRKLSTQRTELLRQLSDLIADCTEQNEDQLRAEAVTMYCILLLESENETSAQKVLNVLTEADTVRAPNLNVFKSKALQLLGRLDESADCMLRAIEPNRCENTAEAMELLSEIVDKIDRFENDDQTFIANCRKLAQFCYDCLDEKTKQRAGLFLIEISIFPVTKSGEELSRCKKLLNNLVKDGLSDNVDLLRCRARLLAGKAKFDEAAGLWAQIAGIRKSEIHSADKRSWKWWRAKYYELYCWSKCPQTEKDSLLHTIEVLENSFQDIPPLWAEKLSSLKQQCKSQLINAGN